MLSVLERGFDAYIPEGVLILFLAGFILGARGLRVAFVADEGLCSPRGFLIAFRSIEQTFI